MPRGIPRDKSVNRKILHRLKIVRGHLDKVIDMVKNDDYCIEIVHQSMAVQAALKEIDRVILKNHVQTCVVDSVKKGNNKNAFDEIIKVIDKK